MVLLAVFPISCHGVKKENKKAERCNCEVVSKRITPDTPKRKTPPQENSQECVAEIQGMLIYLGRIVTPAAEKLKQSQSIADAEDYLARLREWYGLIMRIMKNDGCTLATKNDVEQLRKQVSDAIKSMERGIAEHKKKVDAEVQ